MNFKVALKTINQEGHLAYEYNPFRNYRLNEDVIFYDGQYIPIQEFLDKYTNENVALQYDKIGIYPKSKKDSNSKDKYISNLTDYLKDKTKTAVFYKKGQLVDFITDELDFDLSNPVNITPQWSYDNSVNLIINDGKNPPRIINSRFSPTERNEYQICDRKGNQDTNIYDQGEQFDIDTSLYKKTITIPELSFLGITYGGNLGIGNYHFYFKYVDEDGNESDFFAESGLVSIFIGNTADSIYSGFRHENSHKQVKFLLQNTDVSYSKVVVYYTKATSDILENAVVSAYRIEEQYLISKQGIINITGFESVTQVTLDDINMQYQQYGSVETQAVAQNMLFLANVDKPKLDYEDLADCALRFCPKLYTEKYNIDQVGNDYRGSVKNTYYDPNYIYERTGYWDDEIYRFGVVFIKSDNTLTEVFNVRGIDKLNIRTEYEPLDFLAGKNRRYINFDEFSYKILQSDNTSTNSENARGVVRIDHSEYSDIIGIKFEVAEEVITYLKEIHKIKGLFFVRQKRIPTTLCQAYTIPVDSESHTPALPLDGENYIVESFLNQKEGTLSEDFDSRKIELPAYQCRDRAAICPEYDVNSPYLNNLFTASEFTCRAYSNSSMLDKAGLQCTTKEQFTQKEAIYQPLKVLGVEDNVKLVAINDTMFSARAGEPEEAFRYAYAGIKKVSEDNRALLRGSYGPYLGITGYEDVGKLIDIKIPGYSVSNMDDYFSIRYQDKSPYFAISDRIDLYKQKVLLFDEEIKDEKEIYTFKKPFFRGDCYVCQFTHRFNRNFQDPSAPTNDEIVDVNTWKDNFKVEDGIVNKEAFDGINLGDVNAVPLGVYITLTVRSTMNLNIRAIDESIVDETAMTGHPRGFYPYSPLTTHGAYKTPEALCYNKGFEKSTSERYNFEVPDVPWIKNEFSNRIAYSNIQVNDAFQNGWRTFMGSHYRDYPKTYGSITKLVELGGNLLCVFEHGIGLIPVNERALAGEGSGGAVYINTSNVLPENPKIISDKYGSQWRESIIKTPTAVYGVDTTANKIWKTNGDSIEYISDFRIQEFLNKNISLTERELTPIIGIRNVKTHYNAFKGDVMFTFYDNLHGFTERVWNLCWNEKMQKWITFYSWVPSYSENIWNSFFSFDRNTSKWIAKLGISKSGNAFSDGITLSEVVIGPYEGNQNRHLVGALSLSNRTLPSGNDVTPTVTYSLERDNWGNYKYFFIAKLEPEEKERVKEDCPNAEYGLFIGTKLSEDTDIIPKGFNYSEFCSEFYSRKYTEGSNTITLFENGERTAHDEEDWKNKIVNTTLDTVFDEDTKKRVNLKEPINEKKRVILLNIKASITVDQKDGISSDEALAAENAYTAKADAGYYQSTVAVISKYNLQFLTTDFWKHGQAGRIDIADEIKPTYWYGKQHPFEFEFVVAENPDTHKIFNNLELISNKAEPESFHYEVIGESYDFAKDKKNMYIRQEAIKELYQYNGIDIEFDDSYKTMDNVPRNVETNRPITDEYKKPYYAKSTIFPQWYYRKDTINEIEDSYHLQKSDTERIRYDQLAGAEIVYYDNLNEFRVWNHAKAVNMKDEGRLRGNMEYKEDRWRVQINPINYVQKNEKTEDWDNVFGSNNKKLVPAETNLFNVIDTQDITQMYLPKDWTRNIVSWNNYEKNNKETKMKDKFIKIRIRYSGEDLAVISAIKTIYTISYA